MGQARAICDWMMRNITFTPDPRGIEGLQSPEWTLDYRRGDCDDYTTLVCSLLGTIGMKCRMVTIAADSRDPDQFSHIYPETYVDGQWVTVDAARRHPEFGKQPANYSRKRWWAVDDEAWGDMAHMRGLGLNVAPNALPGAYRANASPVLEAVNARYTQGRQQRRARLLRKRAGLGYVSRGHYRRLHGLGDWSDFADNLPTILTSATTGAANIITAERANPMNLFPTTGATSRVPAGYTTGSILPQGYTVNASGQLVADTTFGGISSSTLLLIGVGLIGAFALANRK